MIKVIHVISDLKIGGTGRWLLNLLKYTDKSSLLVKVVLPRGSILRQEIEALGFETVEIDGMADKSMDTGTIGSMLRIFRNEKPQIVHTHAALSARIAARLAGVKLIVHTKHCIDTPKSGIKKNIAAMANRLLSDKVVAVSEATRNSVIASGIPADSVETIYNGIDALRELGDDEKSRIREELGIEDSELVIGVVARLVELKGHKYLLEAVKQLCGRYDNIRLLIVGTGPLENKLKNYASELGIADKVVFAGFRSDVENIMNIIDISVLPSLTEALSLSLIEGMAVGKPCVGSQVGGIPEVVRDGENGFLVPPGDSKKLADAIGRLLESGELRLSMGQKGKAYMEEKFTASGMADKIERLYEQCLKGRR